MDDEGILWGSPRTSTRDAGAIGSLSDLKVLVSRKLVDRCALNRGGVMTVAAVGVESLIPGEVLGEENADKPAMVSVGRVSRGESPDNEVEFKNEAENDRAGAGGRRGCCACNMYEGPESSKGFNEAVIAMGEASTTAGGVRESFNGSVVQLRSKSREGDTTDVLCRFCAWTWT